MLLETRHVAFDGVSDAGGRLGAGAPLRYATRQGRTGGNEDAIFVLFDEHPESHEETIARNLRRRLRPARSARKRRQAVPRRDVAQRVNRLAPRIAAGEVYPATFTNRPLASAPSSVRRRFTNRPLANAPSSVRRGDSRIARLAQSAPPVAFPFFRGNACSSLAPQRGERPSSRHGSPYRRPGGSTLVTVEPMERV